VATDTRTIKRHAVQTSADFSAWTTQTTVRCNECSEGAGQIVGAASLVRFIGVVREPGATGSPASQAPLTGLVGKWVRVLIEDAGGSVTISSVNYAPLWHGVIDAERIVDTGGGTGQQSWVCSGIAAHLARTALTNGWTEAIGSGGTTVADYILRVPTFNAPDGGGRSGIDYTIDGVSCRVFDYFSGNKWTAFQILETLLAAHGRWDDPAGSPVGGLTWALSAGTLLDWEAPTIDLNGMSLLDAVNALIAPRRGLTWRVTVSSGTATINVRSISAADITVGSTTLPAATDTAAPTLTGLWIQAVELTEDQSATYDVINVIGARPWVGVSLAYDPANATAEAKSLIAGWASGDATTWATNAGPTTDAVWRTFKLAAEWDGRNYGSSTYGLRQNLTISGSDFTGVRAYDSAVDFPPAVMSLVAELPCSAGLGTDKAGPRQECMAFWKPKESSTWYDLQADRARWSRNLTVEDYPPTIHLGNPSRVKKGSDQEVNKFCLETSGVLVVTVGMREPDPLIVSWTRSSASWPRTNPRTLAVHMPNAEQWVMLQGTVTGISGGGSEGSTLATQSAESVIRDDVPLMQSWLAFLRAYFGEPARSLRWTAAGTIEHAYGSGAAAPGALVTTATMGTGATTINATVTRRTWRLDEDGYGTSYDTDRIVPDIEAIR
jgi:hypothetical protein